MEPTPAYEQARQYLETKLKLLKLEGVDKTSVIIAEGITYLIMAFFLLATFIFFCLSLTLLAAQLLHSAWAGFCCIIVVMCSSPL